MSVTIVGRQDIGGRQVVVLVRDTDSVRLVINPGPGEALVVVDADEAQALGEAFIAAADNLRAARILARMRP